MGDRSIDRSINRQIDRHNRFFQCKSCLFCLSAQKKRKLTPGGTLPISHSFLKPDLIEGPMYTLKEKFLFALAGCSVSETPTLPSSFWVLFHLFVFIMILCLAVQVESIDFYFLVSLFPCFFQSGCLSQIPKFCCQMTAQSMVHGRRVSLVKQPSNHNVFFHLFLVGLLLGDRILFSSLCCIETSYVEKARLSIILIFLPQPPILHCLECWGYMPELPNLAFHIVFNRIL